MLSVIPAFEPLKFMAIDGIDIPEDRLVIYEMLLGIRYTIELSAALLAPFCIHLICATA
jgi:hypothetical protein